LGIAVLAAKVDGTISNIKSFTVDAAKNLVATVGAAKLLYLLPK
jgi:hypothetical protein